MLDTEFRSMGLIRVLRSGALCLSIAAATACDSEDPQVVEVSFDKRGDVPSWEAFLVDSVHTVEGEYYIVEGDIPVHSLEALRAHYDEHYTRRVDKLAVRVFNGADEIWPNGDQRALEYCVSTSFSASGFWSRTNVLAAMATASARWKQVANIDFTYVPSRDSDCLSGSAVPHSRFFKVAPKTLSGAFACAFFPISRFTCSELDGSTVGVSTGSQPALSATRTLTHELGHVLGLKHEYERADAPCAVGNSRNLTEYDVTSIMQASSGHCGSSPTESLSPLDGVGILSLYGMPPAWLVPLTY